MSEIEKLNYEKQKLLSDKSKYQVIIKKIEKEILEKEMQIVNVCKKNNNGHKWISESEDGPYGEKYTFCERCRIDYYGGYMHQ